MAKFFNRAKMTTTTTGSGTVTLGSASNGFQTFADAGVSNGDVVQYVIEDGANFEIGTGTYSSSGTSLTRTPTESSNSDNAINLSGSATVSITAVADDLNRLQHNGSNKVTVSSTGASVTGNLSVSGTVDGVDIAARDGVLTTTKTTADAALPKAGGTVTGAVTFPDGDNSPKFKEIRYTDAKGMKVIQTYMGSSYFTSGEYQKVIRVTPSSNSQNWHIRGRLIAQSGSVTQVLNINSSLRSNTLPDLSWTNAYTEELSTASSRYIEPHLWTDETNGDFILVVKVLAQIYGNITVELDVIERNTGYLDDVSVYREPITEQTTVDTGYTERDFDRLTLLTTSKLDVGGDITLSGTVDGVDIASRDAVLTSTTTTANAALPKAGGTMTGSIRLDQESLSASGGTLTINLNNANNFKITMTANTTFAFSNVAAGRGGNLIIVQDATGGRTFTLPAACKTPVNGATIVQSTGASEISILSYYVVDSSNILVNYIGDFA